MRNKTNLSRVWMIKLLSFIFILNSPAFAANSYLEKVSIPTYDSRNADHLIVNAANWNNGAVLNTANVHHYYVEAGKYRNGSYHTEITQTGTVEEPRTISLYNPSNPTDDTHPASLPDNEQADMWLRLKGASYWTIDRISYLDNWDKGRYAGIEMVENMGTYATHNIVNRWHARNMFNGVSIDPFCDYNTVQNSYLDTAAEENLVIDAMGVLLVNNNVPNTITRGTKVLNNDIKNLTDGIQLVVSGDGSLLVSFPETTLDSNNIWIDSDIYTNGDYSTNGLNPSGEYALGAEQGIDLKAGSDESNNPVVITNNRIWGYREIDPTTAQNAIGGQPLITSKAVSNVIIDSNIFFDSILGINIISLYGNNVSKFTNNIISQIGEYTPSTSTYTDGRTPVSLITANHADGTEVLAITYSDNTFVDIYTNQAGSSNTMQLYEKSGMTLSNNLFISTTNFWGNASTSTIDNNWYYNNNGKSLGGSNQEIRGASDEATMENYNFEYERFTTAPKTKTLTGVISRADSPHYEKAGSSIAQATPVTSTTWIITPGSLIRSQ